MARLMLDKWRERRSTLILLASTAVLLAGADAVEDRPSRAEAAGEFLQAFQLKPDIENGLRIYRICAACHQPEGWGLPDGSYPQLAGQHRRVIIKQLADIREGLRSNPEMYPFASPERIGGASAIADVAGYIDTLEMSIDTGKGPGDALEQGEALYAAQCARCHGPTAEGDGDMLVPRLQSQHYRYLLRQFQAIRDGKRGNAHPEMLGKIQGVSDSDASAILDYVSRLEPPKELQAPPGWKNPDFPE